jgi:3-deoxy-manno-octulosonate cytidylyltransferase (CMP-KDO synthetase)
MGAPRVLGVIPARLGSTRLPGKVLRPLRGRPLVLHAHDRLSEATLVDDVLIATDSREVEEVARREGARVVLVTEPCATGSDRVARAAAAEPHEIVVNLQADQPLIDPHDIDRAIRALEEDRALDISTLAFLDDDARTFMSRDVVKVVTDESGRALYFSRAPIPSSKSPESGNPLYLHHVGIYCFRRPALARFAGLPRGDLELRESLEQLRALANGMAIGVVLAERGRPGVDRADDLTDLAGETSPAG